MCTNIQRTKHVTHFIRRLWFARGRRSKPCFSSLFLGAWATDRCAVFAQRRECVLNAPSQSQEPRDEEHATTTLIQCRDGLSARHRIRVVASHGSPREWNLGQGRAVARTSEVLNSPVGSFRSTAPHHSAVWRHGGERYVPYSGLTRVIRITSELLRLGSNAGITATS